MPRAIPWRGWRPLTPAAMKSSMMSAMPPQLWSTQSRPWERAWAAKRAIQGRKKSRKEGGGDEEAVLGAEVVAEEVGVDAVGGEGVEAFVGLEVEGADARGSGFDEVGFLEHEAEEFFGAEEVTEVVEERGPHAAEAVVGAGGVEAGKGGGEVEVGGVGEGDAVEVGEGGGVGEEALAGEAVGVSVAPGAHGFALRWR
jgi:hypothetical protein